MFYAALGKQYFVLSIYQKGLHLMKIFLSCILTSPCISLLFSAIFFNILVQDDENSRKVEMKGNPANSKSIKVPRKAGTGECVTCKLLFTSTQGDSC